MGAIGGIEMLEIIVVNAMVLIWIALAVKAIVRGEIVTSTVGIFGAIEGYLAARKGRDEAMKSNTQAKDAALAEEEKFYTPYEGFNTDALASLKDLLGYNGADKQAAAMDALKNSEAYKFRLGQGQQAIERSAAARGGLFSGKTGAALQEYGQGMASQEYANEYNRRLGLTQFGADLAGNHYRRRGDIQSNFYQNQGNIDSGYYKQLRNVQQDSWNNLLNVGNMVRGNQGTASSQQDYRNPYSSVSYRKDGSYAVNGQGYYDYSY